MSKYGWVINVERCNYLDPDSGESIFNVNLARPWAEEHALADGRGPQISDANTNLGDLLFPWSWSAVTWRCFGRDAGGVWRSIAATHMSGTSQQLRAQDVTNLGAAVRTEVESCSDKCDYPFSQTMEDFWKVPERSHVHALAPLTHWPALVSEKVLKLSCFLSIAPVDLAGLTHVVAFPEFDITPTPLLPSAQIRLQAGNPPLAPPQHALTGGSKIETVASYEGDVAFHGLAAGTADATFVTGKPVLSQGLATRSSIRSSVQDFLLPAQLLRRWLQQENLGSEPPKEVSDEDVRIGLSRSLWHTLGIGREPRPDEENVLELLLQPEKSAAAATLRSALHGFALTDQAAGDAIVAAVTLLKSKRAAVGTSPWSDENQKRWDLRLKDFERVAGKSTTAMFSTAWASVAEMVLGHETGLEIYGPWLADLLDGTLRPQLPVDWPAMRARLQSHGGMRADLMDRARGSCISPAQWLAVRAIINLPDFDSMRGGLGDAALQPLVDATLANVEALLPSAAAYASIEPTLRPLVKAAVRDWASQMQDSSRNARRRPRDRGIRLDFSGITNPAGGDVNTLRGYAIALCGGLATIQQPWVADTTRAAWLTDTALRYEIGGAPDWLDGAIGTAWMHETVGATHADGEPLLSVEYEGAPLAAPLTEDSDKIDYEPGADGFKSVELAWRKSARKLPLLGYGMLYKAAATAIDNAGGVVDVNYRLSRNNLTDLAKPAALGDFADSIGALHYRSSEPPGAPAATTLPDEHLYELSEETQAHAYQHRSGVDHPAKVALLAHDSALFPRAASSCTLLFRPPKAHFSFIERWINTDRILIENGIQGAVSDARLAAYTSDELERFIETFRERVAKDAKTPVKVPDYHPAVAALGVEVLSPGFQKAIALPFARLEPNTLAPAKFELQIEVKSDAGGALDVTGAGSRATVTVPQGRFVCVRVYALVSADHFQAGGLATHRFADGIQLPEINGLQGWCAFGPAEHWFETIPKWDHRDFEHANAALALKGPRDEGPVVASPNLVTATITFDAAAPWVHWVKGVHAQRHDWHWAGYPVDFPAPQLSLDEWLPSLAGVESFREIVDAQLATSFGSGSQWTLGPDGNNSELFFRHELAAGRRPARYVAVFARPMIRFRRWLDPKRSSDGPASLERRIWGAGLMVPGRPEPGTAGRLPVPVLRRAIPLTATYARMQPPARQPNGALLVFEEALHRTDDLAKLGGVGDVLEVDLVETRVSGVDEMGNNPIFHGVARPWSSTRPLKLRVHRPFGLTFDIGMNAKVAQTALLVSPEHAGGNWILAKARVRRAVLPETELSSRIDPGIAPRNADPGVKGWYGLTCRIEGDEAVPPDIVLDVGPVGTPSVRIQLDGVDRHIVMPPSPGADARYVISWHKARWGEGASHPTWRCQVLTQQRDPKRMAWHTVDKAGGYQQQAAELPKGCRERRIMLGVDLAPPDLKVRRIRLSDYTDPVWLTFIGSLGQEQLAAPGSLVFDIDASGLGLRAKGGGGAPVPKLRGLDECLADDSDPRCHIILFFRQAKDVTRGEAGREGGVLAGVYWKGGGLLKHLPQTAGDPAPDLTGCLAHVVALQRITALSTSERHALESAATFPALLDLIFPEQLPQPRESVLRFLPEYLGPIEVA